MFRTWGAFCIHESFISWLKSSYRLRTLPLTQTYVISYNQSEHDISLWERATALNKLLHQRRLQTKASCMSGENLISTRMWQGMQQITNYRGSHNSTTHVSASLSQELNHFFPTSKQVRPTELWRWWHPDRRNTGSFNTRKVEVPDGTSGRVICKPTSRRIYRHCQPVSVTSRCPYPSQISHNQESNNFIYLRSRSRSVYRLWSHLIYMEVKTKWPDKTLAQFSYQHTHLHTGQRLW